jgi:integrase/recombinase XerD
MPKLPNAYKIERRTDSDTFLLSITPTSGLPERVCRQWKRKSFALLPPQLAKYRNPKTKAAARVAVQALIDYLKSHYMQPAEDDKTTVGQWLILFTKMETSPRVQRNIARNGPYSPVTLQAYDSYYRVHLAGDSLMDLLMIEVEEADIMQWQVRLSTQRVKDGGPMAGSRNYEGTVKFVRMCFAEYEKEHSQWLNPFHNIDPPKNTMKQEREGLTEDEVLKLFMPGVLLDPMERAVCAAMFWAGLRKAEIFALQPEDLDWTGKRIIVRHAWEDFNHKDKVLGPPKSKKPRETPFDDILQEAIKALWEANGQHKFVFAYKNGTIPGASWLAGRFRKWLERAGIDTTGRRIVPHSSRHSLASLLEARGVPLRYIQELLGHSDLKTTHIYLHTPDDAIKEITERLNQKSTEKS